jgi:hypothetical protein
MFRSLPVALGVALFSTASVEAQAPNWDWAVSMGDSNSDYCYALATDPSGNVYATGYFIGTVDFDPGPSAHNMSSHGGLGIYLSKFNSVGELVWAISFGSPGYKAGASVKTDSHGHVYLTGLFTGSIDMDPGPGITQLTSVGSHDIFVAKFTDQGSLVWALAIGGPDHEGGSSMAIDDTANGAVYVAGSFSGPLDFDPGPGVFEMDPDSLTDAFILKLDTAGHFVWARSLASAHLVPLRDMAVSPSGDGSVYTVGYFEGTIDMDPDLATTYTFTSVGGTDLFVNKLSAEGDLVWAKQFGGMGFEMAMAVVVDQMAPYDVYLAGNFQNTVDFDTSPAVTTLTAAGAFDAFIAKLNSSGAPIWAKGFGAHGDEYSGKLVLDPTGSGNVIACAYFNHRVDFDPAPGTEFYLTSAGGTDMYVLNLNSAGEFNYAHSAGGFAPDMALALAAAPNGDLYVGGSFFSPEIAMGNTTLTNAFDGGYTGDIFIAKLGHLDVGVEERTAFPVSVHPNPARDRLEITAGPELNGGLIEIFDVVGRRVLRSRWGPVVDVTSLNQGLYVLRLLKRDRCVFSKRIVIERE